MKHKSFTWITLIIILTTGCDPKYRNGIYPETVANLEFLNSSFDDVNSDISTHNDGFLITYSSNAPSQGRRFELVARSFLAIWDQETGLLRLDAIRDQGTVNVERLAKSPCNQKGPYTVRSKTGDINLFYSTDCNGTYKIYHGENELTAFDKDSNNLKLFDAESNEMYPSFYGKDFLKSMPIGQDSNGTPEKLIFCSDVEGKFNIYEVDLSLNAEFENLFDRSIAANPTKLSLNSEGNDHAPSVFGDLLVFASDRPGGFGGYDLYYSKNINGTWSSPVNFGERINSASDEFRPIIYFDHGRFENLLMIFSSDRPGGKGGFDLYYVGISKN
jgi:hypothetical protein